MSVIAALTAQNTTAVSSVLEVPAHFVQEQLDAVLTDIRPDAVKTGMLLNAAVIEVVASKIRQYGLTNVVVDPVMSATTGAELLHQDAVRVLRRVLLPLAFVITPNVDEAQVLTATQIRTTDDMEEAALQVHAMGASHVLIKG